MPAGFWRRYAAWSLDAALLALPAAWIARVPLHAGAEGLPIALGQVSSAMARVLVAALDARTPLPVLPRLLLDDPALLAAVEALQSAVQQMLAWPLLAITALAFAWHVGFEQSRWRGSPGKRALSLVVTDAEGRPPRWGRSVARFVAGSASWLTLNVGHALAALPPDHLALHDRVSATRVVALRAAPLPAWAKAWLLAQLLGGIAACVLLAVALDAAVQAALMRALAA